MPRQQGDWRLHESKEITAVENLHASPWVKFEKGAISGDDERSATIEGEREEFVVVRIAAVGDDGFHGDVFHDATDGLDDLLALGGEVAEVAEKLGSLNARFKFAPGEFAHDNLEL